MKKQALYIGSLIVLAFSLAGCDDTTSSQSAANKDSSVQVGVVTLNSQSVALTSELPGRVLASATAVIRPQVDGIVRKQVFREGSEVK